MNGQVLQRESVPHATPSSAWGYVSGRVSVLETMLLSRDFFGDVFRCNTLTEARSLLAKTMYRQKFPTDDSVRNYARILEFAGEEVIFTLFHDSPQHIMEPYFVFPKRYASFRNLFLRASKREATISELENIMDSLIIFSEDESSLVIHRELLRSKDAPQHADTVAQSLFLDSIACSMKLTYASLIPERSIASLITTIALLDLWSCVVRSVWNGTSTDVVQHWFIVPDTYRELVKNSARLAESTPGDAAVGFIPEKIAQKLRGFGFENLRKNIDDAILDVMHDDILVWRYIPYGPERVVTFIFALHSEQENLKIALSSVVHGIDPDLVRQRLRRDYA